MSSDRARSLAAVLLGLVMGSGCADFRRGAYWDESTSGAAATDTEGMDGGPSFATDVYPILLADCQSCHSPDGTANATALLITSDVEVTYAAALDFVTFEYVEDSRLLRKARGVSHGGGVVLDDTTDAYETIVDWITNGAMP